LFYSLIYHLQAHIIIIRKELIKLTIGGKAMSYRFTAVITKEGIWYVAHCVELGVVSQGKNIEEAQANLKEAVELYIESFGTDDLPESKGEVIFYPLEVIVNA